MSDRFNNPLLAGYQVVCPKCGTIHGSLVSCPSLTGYQPSLVPARLPASEPPAGVTDAEIIDALGGLVDDPAHRGVGYSLMMEQSTPLPTPAELAALRAEVERAVLECNAAVKLINQKVRERDAARAEVERLSAALQFYAEPTNWHSHPVTRDLWKYFPPSPVAQDCGAVAKLALAPPAEGPGR